MEEIFELIENIKEIFEDINSYIPIYLNINIEIENIKFFKKYKMPTERADREIITDMKNSARP